MPELVRFVAQGKPVIRWYDLAVFVDRAEDHEVRARALRTDLGHLERPEAARERELRLVGHGLAAKDKDRVLFDRRARLLVCGGIRRDLGKRHTAELGGKARTQRDDFHQRTLSRLRGYSTFHQNRPAGKKRCANWRFVIHSLSAQVDFQRSIA